MSKAIMKLEDNFLISEKALKTAEILSKSTMVPQQFQKNVGNCLIALNFAARSGADPFLIMQSIYIVNGRPAMETKLLVALFNSDGRFSPLEYEYSPDRQECRCYATRLSSKQKLEGPIVSIKMAKDEGWYQKKMSKWPTMPETMLGYRAAAFFIRRYAPEVTFGMPTTDEAIDMEKGKASETYEMVKQEIDENANKKLIDIAPAEKEPEYEKPELKEANPIMLKNAKKLNALEKKAGRNKEQTLSAISGFVERDIERLSDLTEDELLNYIFVVERELTEGIPENQQDEQKPEWMNQLK